MKKDQTAVSDQFQMLQNELNELGLHLTATGTLQTWCFLYLRLLTVEPSSLVDALTKAPNASNLLGVSQHVIY